LRERWWTWERLEDLLCEVGLFVSDSLAVVAGVFYYLAIGFIIFMAVHFRIDGSLPLWRQRVGLVRAMELCIGTALLWGLAHLIARALDARQTARDAAIALEKARRS
jgi:hypothetical protein